MRPVPLTPPPSPHEEWHARGNQLWRQSTLIGASKDLEVYDLPVYALDLDAYPWDERMSVANFVDHAHRMRNAGCWPVIISPDGEVLNGWHRIAHAVINGRTSVTAVRLETMPPPDREDA